MKNILLTIFFINAFLCSICAQNMVPNHSFEQADSCPTALNTRTYKYSLGCVGWGQATTNTADYYNACDTAATSIGKPHPLVGTPRNLWGYEGAYDGTAYTGICMYFGSLPFYKEYLIATLPSLQKDTAYKVTIHISLADSSRYACDGMGVLFTTYGSPNQSTGGTLTALPQINYSNYGVISDTANWVTISSVFVADSEYTNIIIGGFMNSGEMNIVDFNNAHKVSASAAYYYIDNIIVEKLSGTYVNETYYNEVQVFPNPFFEYATVIFNNPTNETYQLKVFNSQGQIAQYKNNITSNSVKIERNNLPAGFYYYQLHNANGIEASGKLIIK